MMNDTYTTLGKEYISQDAYEKLMDYLCQKSSIPEIQNALRRLIDMDYTCSYDELYPMLSDLGISMKEFFQIIGLEPEWPDKSFYTLQKKLEVLEKADYSSFCRIKAFAHSLLPVIWDTDFYGSLPSRRIAALVQNSLDYTDRQTFKNSHKSILHQKTVISDIPTESLVPIANELGVSFKWIMCIPDDMPVISKSAEVEQILQDYSFMSDSSKGLFSAVIKNSNKKEGTYE